MPVLMIPTPIRSYVDGQSEIHIGGRNVREALENLLAEYPALRPHLVNVRGKPRAFVNLFIGEHNIRDLKGLQTPVGEADVVRLVFSIAGG
ncbi:MAG: MoaD/ThiS family protein [Bacteroidota bacterium]